LIETIEKGIGFVIVDKLYPKNFGVQVLDRKNLPKSVAMFLEMNQINNMGKEHGS